MKILTWNISHTNPSSQAPKDWDQPLNLHEIHKIIEDEEPDIFTLQEMPNQKFRKRFVNYHQTEPVSSHSGFVGVFLKKDYEIVSTVLLPPSIVTKISKKATKKEFYFIGTHLTPHKQNAEVRQYQISIALDALIPNENPAIPLIIAGDMNMRENETKPMLKEFELEDAYLESSQSKDTKYTWNSRVNLYRDDAFQFACRFDRVFLKHANVKTFKLIGNKPASENRNHFLSDHFGIVVEIEFN